MASNTARREPRHAFVDESKVHDYVLVAATVPACELADARRDMRGLLLPRQPRIHFRDEQMARKIQILKTVINLGLEAVVCTTPIARDEVLARSRCLTAMTSVLIENGTSQIVIELD